MRRRHLLLLGMIVACGGTASDATTSTFSVTTLATTTTTLPTTTTTLGPEQVVEVFVGHMTDASFQSEAELALETTFGDITVAGSGHSWLHGDDYRSVIEFAGMEQEEYISFGGIDYERDGNGPWISDERRASPFDTSSPEEGPPLDMIAMLKTIGDLEHQSTVEEEGVTLHRIGLPPGMPADPVAFGFAPDAPVEVDVVFWARDDGSPHRLEFLVVDSSDPDGTINTRLEMTFVAPEGPIEIIPPDDAWLRHHSEEWGYTIAYPSGWDAGQYRGDEFPETDYFLGLAGEEIDVFRTDLGSAQEVSLNASMSEFRSAAVSEGFEAGDTEEIEVAGLPGRMLITEGDDESGEPVVWIYAAAQTAPDTLFEFVMYGYGYDPDATRLLLLDFISTFELNG